MIRPFTVTSECRGQVETVDSSADELLLFLAFVPLLVMAAKGDPVKFTVAEDADGGWTEPPARTTSWDPVTAGIQRGTASPEQKQERPHA